MTTAKTESDRIIKFTLTQFVRLQVIIIAFVVSVTFSGTLIWSRFLTIEGQTDVMVEKQNQKDNDQDQRIEYVNDRIDRKFKQIEEKLIPEN